MSMESLVFNHFASIIFVFIAWLLIIFLLTTKTNKRISNLILVAFLLVTAQDNSGLLASVFVYPYYPGLGMLINSTVFLKMPLLYLYLLSVIYSDFKFSKKHLWHLIPFILNFIVFIPGYYLKDFDAKWAFLEAPNYDRKFEIIASYLIVHLQIGLYAILCFRLVIRYKRLLLENFSNANLFNFNWLFQLVSIIMISCLVGTFKNVFKFMHIESVYSYAVFVVSMLSLGIISWMVLKALHNPELFTGINSNLQLVKQLVPSESSTHKDNKPEFEKPEIKALKTFMDENEPFLNASLSIEDLANQIKMPPKDLSVLINHDLNQHFFDFINTYRINKAKEILKDPAKNKLTILEILYKVGFNSKSSFNTAFKKTTGKTPSEYRKTHSKSSL